MVMLKYKPGVDMKYILRTLKGILHCMVNRKSRNKFIMRMSVCLSVRPSVKLKYPLHPPPPKYTYLLCFLVTRSVELHY